MRSDGRSAKQLVRFFVIGCVRDGLRAPCPPTLAKLRVLAFVLVKTHWMGKTAKPVATTRNDGLGLKTWPSVTPARGEDFVFLPEAFVFPRGSIPISHLSRQMRTSR